MTDNNLSNLTTEARHPLSEHLDELPTASLVELLHSGDHEALDAVQRILPQIATAIDTVSARMAAGGRLFYSGAGTSGRLGVLDASECPPTYNTTPDMVQAVIAGGDIALRTAVEGAEDQPELGGDDLIARNFNAKDTLVAIAASGRTPYVLGAIEYARSLGAFTIGLSCVANSPVAETSDLALTPLTGPEIVTGSTRMKAGTATKLVLNMLSTGVMVRLGYVYGNLMVNVQPTNAKLRDRSTRIIATLTGLDALPAATLLDSAGSVRVAILMHRLSLDRAAATARLQAANGSLRAALRTAGSK
jgi:N-acetylmuramic acid 6-phosphate etherase